MIDVVLADVTERYLAYIGYEGRCFVFAIEDGRMLCSFASRYQSGGVRAFVDSRSQRMYVASYSPSMLFAHDLNTGEFLSSVRLNRRIDAIMNIERNLIHARSHPSIVVGNVSDGMLSRRLSGTCCPFSYKQRQPYVVSDSVKEKTFLLNSKLEKSGMTIPEVFRGAVQLDERHAFAWNDGDQTRFYVLDFETANVAEVFVIKRPSDFVYMFYDNICKYVHLFVCSDGRPTQHIRYNGMTNEVTMMRNKVHGPAGACHIKRLDRIYYPNGLVYHLAAADYLEPIMLK